MNNKGEILIANVINLVIVLIFLGVLSVFAASQMNNGSNLSDYYAKEIAKMIDLSKPGDEIILNVQKATEIAGKNNVNFNEIFQFDNEKNEVCVKMSVGTKNCYSYFNNVDVVNPKIELASPLNSFKFKIVEGGTNG